MAISKFSNSTVATGFPKLNTFWDQISPTANLLEYIVVAGGGGGGSHIGGGGGSGGFTTSRTFAIVNGTSYTVTIGGGGTGSTTTTDPDGTNGSNSVFSTVTAIGGGKGGSEDKLEAMRLAGISVSDSPAELGRTMLKLLGK